MPTAIQKLKQEKGITGLETAIILIAFVIVASVLSYVVISAGLFSSQKAKTAVNAGLSQAGSTIELKGNVVVDMSATNADSDPCSDTITFIIGLVPGGNAIDLTPNSALSTADPYVPGGSDTIDSGPYNNSLIVSYQDYEQSVANLFFKLDYINANNGDDMLDPGELVMVTVFLDPASYTTIPNLMASGLTPGRTFTLTLTPSDGSILPIERTMPKRSSGMVNLY